VADLDPTLMKEVLQVARRQWETNVEHRLQADDLWARLEVAQGLRVVIPKGYADALPASSQFLLTKPLGGLSCLNSAGSIQYRVKTTS
jgi:hypothetical protein